MYRDGDRARTVREPPRAHSLSRASRRTAPTSLKRVGDKAEGALDIRLSTHPGQYTVLNSEDERTATARPRRARGSGRAARRNGSRSRMRWWSSTLAAPLGARQRRSRRFERSFALLSDAARSRLVIENDDRSFGLADVLVLSEHIGRPVVWDLLHHYCNDPDGISDRDALRSALATWPGTVTPKVHYSSSRTSMGERRRRVGRRVVRTPELPQLRAHADLVDPIAFEHFVTETARGLELRRHARGEGEGPRPPACA